MDRLKKRHGSVKHQLKVVVIEDEVSLNEAITIKFNSLGVETVNFDSGIKALDFLKSLGSLDPLPDLIWLDYYIKDCNGIEFMEELNKYNRLVAIPVIVVSNSASPQKVQQMLDLGAKKYILKAENRLDDIVETVNGLIRK